MRLFLPLLFLLFSITPSLSYSQTVGADRCSVRDCLCSVIPGEKPERSYITARQNRRYGVFFQEGDFSISEHHQIKISRFLSNQSQLSPAVTIIGYTDGCGERDYNKALARDRARAIKLKILEEIPSARISIQIEEEETSSHRPESRRVDVIFHSSSRLSTKIEKIPADVYLVDASGSMWSEWGTWSDLINTSFTPGNRIYLSITSGCRNRQTINSVNPQGGTEIWYSYWKVIEDMERGETLLIISDFDTTIPLTRREAAVIERKVRERGIIVKTIISD